MDFRTDTFKIGDNVTWVDDYYAELTDGRKRFGDGPFKIVHINAVNSQNYKSAGHTQHIILDGPDGRFSGAFFKKVD